MHVLRATWRAVQVTAHVLLGALISLATAPLRLLRVPHGWFPHVVSWWHRRLCRLLGMRSDVRGRLEPTALLVANHVSWLDGVLLTLVSARPVRMIAFAGNFSNPWMKRLGRMFGVILIAQGPKSVVAALRTARESLQEGQLVCIFPEGAITRTGQMQAFRPGLLKIIKGIFAQNLFSRSRKYSASR